MFYMYHYGFDDVNNMVLMMTKAKCINDTCQSGFYHDDFSNGSWWCHPIKEEISQVSPVKKIKFNVWSCWIKQSKLKTWTRDFEA